MLTLDRSNIKILDYGSGGGFLARELRNSGLNVECYEPMLDGAFCKEAHIKKYDILILNEVIEHIDQLLITFSNIYDSLIDGGSVLIKTMVTDSILTDPYNFSYNFRHWWYKDDPTHVSFFSSLTFEYICSNIFPDLTITKQDHYSNILQKNIKQHPHL